MSGRGCGERERKREEREYCVTASEPDRTPDAAARSYSGRPKLAPNILPKCSQIVRLDSPAESTITYFFIRVNTIGHTMIVWVGAMKMPLNGSNSHTLGCMTYICCAICRIR
jgi:hypothetical protein